MSLMDYVVTCRFHGVVFAHLMNKPVLALSHHPKVAALMSDMGLSRYCVDIQFSDLSLLNETFTDLVMNKDEIKARLQQILMFHRKALSTQFDELFPPLSDVRPALAS
jgi:polysaccharide pyruvyl transferase WcaK-like protein